MGRRKRKCVIGVLAAAKGWGRCTELTYRGHYFHLFQANIMFLPLFGGRRRLLYPQANSM